MKNIISIFVTVLFFVNNAFGQYEYKTPDGWKIYNSEKPNFSETGKEYDKSYNVVGTYKFSDLYYDIRSESIALEAVYFNEKTKEPEAYEHTVLFYSHLYQYNPKDPSDCMYIWQDKENELDGKPFYLNFRINGSKFEGYKQRWNVNGVVMYEYKSDFKMPFKTQKEAEAFKAKMLKKIIEVSTKPGYTVNLEDFKDFKPRVFEVVAKNKPKTEEDGMSKTDKIRTYGSTVTLGGKTYYKFSNKIYDDQFTEIAFIDGKEYFFGGNALYYVNSTSSVTEVATILKKGKTLCYYDMYGSYLDANKKQKYISDKLGDVYKMDKKIGVKKPAKKDTNGLASTMRVSDIVVLVDYLGL
ncbi:MAG: hypothetical protein MUC49_07105 [Raineya sp.]|jgi:hypothetical protein|nr:hypothetical protein [Raineya sp.]